MDKITPRPCPGKEDEYNEKRGLGGFSIFMITVISFAAAGGFGYWAYQKYEGMFGQIRLGEQRKSSFPCTSIYSTKLTGKQTPLTKKHGTSNTPSS